eukprot:8710816-Pyramimonas_sp.AAC.1
MISLNHNFAGVQDTVLLARSARSEYVHCAAARGVVISVTLRTCLTNPTSRAAQAAEIRRSDSRI